MPGHWPLRSFLELGALPGAVPCARLHARLVAWEWGLAGLGDDLELLVSELLTNAVAAARATQPRLPVRLWLLSDTRQIAVLVWDASPQPPLSTQVDGHAESGRGLLLVEAISQRWGWYPAQYMAGKVVWALLEAEAGEAVLAGRKSGARWLPVRIDDFGKWQAGLPEESASRLGAVLADGGRVHRWGFAGSPVCFGGQRAWLRVSPFLSTR